MEYQWSDSEEEDLVKVCAALTAYFPALKDVEFHLRKEAMCYSSQNPIPDAEPPLHILESITRS